MYISTRWYFIPLNIIQGQPHFFMRPPTNKELVELPHVQLTSDCDLDPASLDNTIDPNDATWYRSDPFIDPYGPHPFDHHGHHKSVNFCLILDHLLLPVTTTTAPVKQQRPDFKMQCPNFGWCSVDVICHTFDNTTQFACTIHLCGGMRKHY
jgi:hypothetical protein